MAETMNLPPSLERTAFTCPHCLAFAHQYQSEGITAICDTVGDVEINGIYTITICSHCNLIALWYGETLVYPFESPIPLPATDMPDDVQKTYEEARQIATLSPRASAALLRLAIEQLIRHLGQDTDNLNQAIGNLVQDGLPIRIQQALDSVRVIGNSFIHPGVLSHEDTIETATILFKLVNIIVERMITNPQEIEAIFDSLPDTKKEQIERRDQQSDQPSTPSR